MLSESLVRFVQDRNLPVNERYPLWHSGVYALIDCIYSAQAKYQSTVLPILQQRLPAHGLEDHPELRFSDFLELVEQRGPEVYAQEVLKNRQRVGGRLKLEVVLDACRFFAGKGLETRADLECLAAGELDALILEDLVRAVKGIGPALARYLLMLVGREDHIKPNTLLVRLFRKLSGWQARHGDEADMGLLLAAMTQAAKALGTTPMRLDYALWRFESQGGIRGLDLPILEELSQQGLHSVLTAYLEGQGWKVGVAEPGGLEVRRGEERWVMEVRAERQ